MVWPIEMKLGKTTQIGHLNRANC